MAAQPYQAALETIRSWLVQGRLSPYADVLIEEGYDDIDCIRRCNQSELLELLALFKPGGDRIRARRHIDALRGQIRPPASPSSDDTESSVSISRRKSIDPKGMSSRASSMTTAPLQEECRVRIRCVYLYQEEWVARSLVLHDNKIYCYPDNADQVPEFSVNVGSARTVIRQQSASVISIADRGQHHILIDFGHPETLTSWQRQLQQIQADVRPEDGPGPDYDELLQRGHVFKKIKNTTASRRRIWCTPDRDKLVWGRPSVDHDVCGFIRASSIQVVGHDAALRRLNVVTTTRTLTIEATESTDSALLATWADAIRYVHGSKVERQMQRDIRLENPEERQKLRRRRERCEDLLNAGDVFRKLKHGAAVTRKVACTPDMALLQWKDEAKGRIKGQLSMADIAWIDKEAERRFRIVAKQRIVELEAVDGRTRDLWVEVLRFWIYVNSERYEAATTPE